MQNVKELDDKVLIRPAVPDDVPVMARYQVAMAMESEGMVLDYDTVRLGTLAILDDASKGTYYVAEKDGRLVGSLLITKEWSDWRNRWIWWIQSVYTVPDCRRQGVYSALYSYVKKKVEAADDISGLRLYADKNNVNAQRAYRQLGMTDEHYTTFEWMKNK